MNSTTLTGVEFRPLVIPDSIDSDNAADFVAMVDVRNRIYREVSGHGDHAITAAELLPHYRPDEYSRRSSWLILRDGVAIGRLGLDTPLQDGSKGAFWLVELVADARGQGIGSSAYELIEQSARAAGRTVLQSFAEQPANSKAARIEAPTGFGSVPEDDIARFFLRHGYSLEQVERNSAFDLRGSFDRVEELLAEARRAAEGYRIVQWSPPTPPEYVAGYGWLKSRMSTDAPSAALEFDEEEWDAARVARHDALYTDPDAGRLLLVTAAQHIASGELCAFNELAVGKDRTEASHQEDTLVLKEHRGHRLGMLVKCAGLLAWRDLAPESPRLLTYNAEENRPMLDINEAIGFVPIAYDGGWKKVLDE